MIMNRKPRLLQSGATIGVVAPSEPLTAITSENIRCGIRNLEEMGFSVVFSENVRVPLNCPDSARLRAIDLMDFIRSDKIDGIMAAIGGYSSLEILKYLDNKVILDCDKPFIGFSDITVLNNLFLNEAKLINYYGPTFAIFCQRQLPEYTKNSFINMLCSEEQYIVKSSKLYSDDLWYTQNTGEREWKLNGTWYGYNLKSFEGEIVGGNLETLLALAGTDYFPSCENKVLLLEEAKGKSPMAIRREIQQLRLMKVLSDIQAVLFGRFWGWSQADQREFFDNLMDTVLYGYRKPIIANLDFGHSDPMMTIPIGGMAKFSGDLILLRK